MRLSKANLAAAAVASRDPRDPPVNRLHVTAAGETVATNGRALLAVEPVDPERAGLFPPVEPEEAEPPEGGVGLPLDVVAEARKAIPKEDKPSLGYVQMTRCGPAEVELMATDGARKRKVAGPPMAGGAVGWRAAMRGAWTGGRSRVLVDRRSLIGLLRAIDDACPDRINRNPVFLEIGGSDEPIILRGINVRTNQHVVGMLKPLGAGGKWLRLSEWEAGLKGGGGMRRAKG